MGDGNKISRPINSDNIVWGLIGVGMGVEVAALVVKLSKEITIATNNMYYPMLQNIYQSLYRQIPANATDIQYAVNATYFNLLSYLQQTTNSIIQTHTTIEHLLYIIGFIIILIAIIIAIINLIKK